MIRTPAERQLIFRIVLEQPPVGVDFAVQKGRGSSYETIQTQRSAGRDLQFEFAVDIGTASKGTGPDFFGPFVQGPSGGRFVYLDIGTLAGQADSCWSRRLKIPLTGLSWSTIDRASEGANPILEAHVPGTGGDGGPSCAS